MARHRLLQNVRLPPAPEARLTAEYELPRLTDEADSTAFLTAHSSASGTVETRQAKADRVFDNLQGFFKDGKLLSSAV
jgi:hydroxypyruvate reductase